MALTKEYMEQTVKDFGRSEIDTGSSEVQIAALTARIKSLTEHMKQNHKDFSSRLGLLKMVSRRRKLLAYLKGKNVESYQDLKNRLGLK